MSFESGKNIPTRIAHRIESEKPETSLETLQKLRVEYPGSVFVKCFLDEDAADAVDLDNAFNMDGDVTFFDFANYTGDAEEMLRALQTLKDADSDDTRKVAVRNIVALVKASVS